MDDEQASELLSMDMIALSMQGKFIMVVNLYTPRPNSLDTPDGKMRSQSERHRQKKLDESRLLKWADQATQFLVSAKDKDFISKLQTHTRRCQVLPEDGIVVTASGIHWH